MSLTGDALWDAGGISLYANLLVEAYWGVRALVSPCVCAVDLTWSVSFNRVRHLPVPSFFEGSPGPAGLETLLCDHNYVSAWEATRASLAAAMALVVLTLARNPIAWSGAYRAAVVNAAPNLKLLDAHIVADEELIEGANFSFTRFAAPVLCEAGERVNTRWGASPALGLDFAGLRRAAASLGGENGIIEHAHLVAKITAKLLKLSYLG